MKARPNVWQLQSRRDVDGLITALQYPDAEVRKRAAVALRTLDATQAIPSLKAALHDETDTQVRGHLNMALHELDHRTDVRRMFQSHDLDGLITALKSRRQRTVILAARALGHLGDRMAVEPLVILFHSATSSPSMRLAAAEALLELKSAPAVVTLLGALRRDSWEVRRNAAAVLGQIQATWAVDPLAEALDDPHPVVRRTAAAALRRIGTAEAVAALRARFAAEAERRKTLPKRPARLNAAIDQQAEQSKQPEQPAAQAQRNQRPQAEQPETTARPAARKRPELVPVAAVPEPAQARAAHKPSVVDTQPLPIPRNNKSQTASQPRVLEPERPSRIVNPVRKLIKFLRPRDDQSVDPGNSASSDGASSSVGASESG